MSIKKLDTKIQSRLNAGAKINNYRNAIEELVHNSLDSDSTCIAIRIDINARFIQVVDNGTGVSKCDIYLLGERYATSKSGDVIKDFNKYGFRGESLANIIAVSESVQITSRREKSEETWRKCFYKGRHKNSSLTTTRHSKGTTVEIKGFLFNSNVQIKEMNHAYEMQNIKTLLQQISLIRTNVSISLRDNTANEIIFKIHKNRDVYQTLSVLFELEKPEIQELQVEKNHYKVQGFVGNQSAALNSLKWIYLNSRFIYNSTLHSIINKCSMKTLQKNKRRKNNSQGNLNCTMDVCYYFIFITCPHLDYEIYFDPERTIIEFKEWNQIKLLMGKFVKFYYGDVKVKEIKERHPEKLKHIGRTEEAVQEIVEKFLGNNKHVKISQLHKGVKGKTITKKHKQKTMFDKIINKNTNVKMSKNVSNNSQCCEMPLQLDNHFGIKFGGEPLVEQHKILPSKIEAAREEGRKQTKKKKHFLIIGSEHSSECSDPMIKKFLKETVSVKRRCNFYSENMKDLLHKRRSTVQELVKVAQNKSDNVTSIEYDPNRVKLRKHRKYSVNDYALNSIDEKTNDVGIAPLAKANKSYLKSYDLVKTIMNTQEYSPRFESTVDQSRSKNNISDKASQSIVLNDSDNLSRLNAGMNVATFTELTYNSHRCIVNNNSAAKCYAEPKKSHNLCRFGTGDKLIHGFNNALSTNSDNKNSHSSYFSENMNNKTRNFNKVPYINSDDYKHVEDQCHGTVIYKISGKRQSTYTVIDTNPSMNVENYVNQTDQVINSQESGECSGQCNATTHFIYSNNSNQTVNELNQRKLDNNKRSPNTNYTPLLQNADDKIRKSSSMSNSTFESFNSSKTLHKTITKQTNTFWKNGNNDDNSKIIDIEMTETSFLFQTSNNHTVLYHKHLSRKENDLETVEPAVVLHDSIDPLNVCEAVYKVDGNNKAKSNTFTRDEDKSFCSISNSKRDNNIDIDSNIFNIDMDKISYHFRNQNTIVLQSQKSNYEETTPKVQNSFNNNSYFESLDICFDTVSEWERIINQNQECKTFNIQNRNNLLPKGTSQILENCESKKFCSYDLEVDYFQDDLYNDFADSVLDKHNLFEARIQGVNENVKLHLKSSKFNGISSCLKFNADSLKKAKVFGQVDNKYIVAQLLSENNSAVKYLVLFDQHAVHERIKLEENLADYIKDDKWVSVDCEILSVKLPEEYLIYLSNFKEKFTQLGLKCTFENDVVLIDAIPKAILGKHCRETGVVYDFIKKLLIEEIKALKSLRGNSLLYPRSIMELMFSEACRYAIKFGDKLNKEKCAILIKSLSNCKTPFQCAHGRPVMAVLLDMKTIDNKYKIDMSKISKFKNKLFT